jgi:hypothetical protein
MANTPLLGRGTYNSRAEEKSEGKGLGLTGSSSDDPAHLENQEEV